MALTFITVPKKLCYSMEGTREDGRMSRASISCFGEIGDVNLTGSNPGRVKPMMYEFVLLGQGKEQWNEED